MHLGANIDAPRAGGLTVPEGRVAGATRRSQGLEADGSVLTSGGVAIEGLSADGGVLTSRVGGQGLVANGGVAVTTDVREEGVIANSGVEIARHDASEG